MIDFSCADFTFPVLSHDKALALIALLNFRWVDIGLFEDRSHIQPSDQLDFPEKKGNYLHALVRRHGLAISDIFLQSALDCEEKAINHPDPCIREQEREIFKRAIEFTIAAGSNHFTGLPGVDFESHDSKSICIDELNWRVEYANSLNVIYSVEPHLGSIMSTPAKAMDILSKCKGLTLTLDHSHYVSQGFSTDAVTPMVKYATHMHFRGAAAGKMQTSVARSTTDFGRVVKDLFKSGYKGKLCIEYCWLEWENCNCTDNVSETILLRELLITKLSNMNS